MKKFIGFCWVGFSVFSAWGAGAPLLLDWGVVDTSGAAQQAASRSLRSAPRAAMVQSLSAEGTAPWLVQFNDVIREEWKTAMEAAGAKLKGYIPENAYLVEATPTQIAAIGAMGDVTYVGEFLPEYKRAAKVRAKLARVAAVQEVDSSSAYRVLLMSGDDLDAVVARIEALTGAAVTVAEGEQIRTDLTAPQIEEITDWGEVQWIEPYSKPRLWNNVSVRTNMMNVSNVWSVLGLTGAGQTIAVCDTGLDTGNTNTLHRDFTNRVTGFGWTGGVYNASYTWADYDEHGTHVSGSVLGNGTMSTGVIKGVAYEANLIMQGANASLDGIPTALATLFRQAFTNGARIHSDSWGYDDYGYYNSVSRAVDQYVWSNQTFLILVAAGNSGTDSNTVDGVIDPMSVASPATAKNCMTVGAAENYRTSGGYSTLTWGGAWPDDYGTVPISADYISRPFSNSIQGLAAFSSRGPCNDGRIKPDIVAPGTDILSTRTRAVAATGWGTLTGNSNYIYMGGTSMATPLTAGAAGLTRQWVTTTGGITNPSASLLKALMLNGARDMTPGQYGTSTKQEITARPDKSQGWGHVDLYNTLQPATNQFLDLYDTNSLATGQTNTFTYTVTSGSTNKFFITLVYADYWGTAGSGKQLVNDLDLRVVKPGGTTNYANGRTSVDATNNVEMIEFAADEAGTYTVRVAARTVPSGSPQAYALVVRGPLADETPAAPVFGANPGPVSTTTGVAVAFTVSASGYPVPTLALQSTTASSGYSFAAGTGQLDYTPPVADGGATKTFTFTATNTEGAVTQTVSVVVYEAPPAAPASIWASATNSTDFTAAWSSVSGATGYRLDVATNATFSGGGGTGGSRTNDCASVGGGTTSSYLTRIWTNNGSVVWTAYKARSDQTVNGNPSICLQNATGAYLISENIPDGIGNLSFVVQQMFTGSGGELTVFVNGSTVDTFAYDATVQTATFANINISGVATLVISNNTSARPAINNLVWTDYGGGAPSYVAGYSNRTVAGTSQSVTGLTATSAYYFRARAVSGGGTSPNSPTASVTTTAASLSDQTITFPAIGAQVTTNTVGLSATASSGLTVAFAVGSGPATISGLTNLSFSGAGAVSIVASQAGNGSWNPAPNVTNSFTVTKATAGVTLGGLWRIYDGTSKSATATTAPLGLTVGFTYNGSASAPSAVGSYAVTGTVSDVMYQGSASATMDILLVTNLFAVWLEDEQGQSTNDPDFAPDADVDLDGSTTWDEFLADTDPNLSNSVLSLTGLYTVAATEGETGSIRMQFPASTGRYYQLEYCTGLTNHLVGTSNLGWGVAGMAITNDSTGTWYGVIRVFLQDPAVP